MIKIGFPHQPGGGGPGSFQRRFENALRKRGVEIIYPFSRKTPDIIFVVGGTKRIYWLLRNKLLGIPIIFRLDGINWLHRSRKAKRDFSTKIQAEISNLLNKVIHGFIADYIVYQSHFTFEWWKRKGWIHKRNFSVIVNGVDINFFTPATRQVPSQPKVVCLEGFLDYSPYAIDLINYIAKKAPIELLVFGDIKFRSERVKLDSNVQYLGPIKQECLPNVYSQNIYISLDVNPACPNTVVEALACGCPVVAFDTGALKELVPPGAGVLVPFGGDPWKLDKPDFPALTGAIVTVLQNYPEFSQNARKHAIREFSLEKMTDEYFNVIQNLLK